MMRRDEDHRADCLGIVAEARRQGRLSRRDAVAALAMLGGAPLLAGRPRAQVREVVVANWGGDATAAFQRAFGDPFEHETGLRFAQDGSGPSPGRIRSMVTSGRVVWDVIDTGVGAGYFLGEAGLLEEMDFSIVDRSLDMPGLAHRRAVGAYTFSVVLAWNTRAFGGRSPGGWAGFCNVRDFPGPRMLRRDPQGVPEAALVADGVPPERLYPLDVERAFRKVRELRPHAVSWGTGAESQQILRQNDAVMGLLWNTRAMLLQRETPGEDTLQLRPGHPPALGLDSAEGQPPPAGRRSASSARCRSPTGRSRSWPCWATVRSIPQRRRSCRLTCAPSIRPIRRMRGCRWPTAPSGTRHTTRPCSPATST